MTYSSRIAPEKASAAEMVVNLQHKWKIATRSMEAVNLHHPYSYDPSREGTDLLDSASSLKPLAFSLRLSIIQDPKNGMRR